MPTVHVTTMTATTACVYSQECCNPEQCTNGPRHDEMITHTAQYHNTDTRRQYRCFRRFCVILHEYPQTNQVN
eukprot:m.53084 g.53084  ORF g.53084 m.53084 type:complete len:73 (+) comp15435_c0_seq4:1380-1598(+)